MEEGELGRDEEKRKIRKRRKWRIRKIKKRKPRGKEEY